MRRSQRQKGHVDTVLTQSDDRFDWGPQRDRMPSRRSDGLGGNDIADDLEIAGVGNYRC